MKKVIVLLMVFVLYAVFAFAGEKVRFIASENGTVLDTRTKLMWATKDNGEAINWASANAYCGDYRAGGFTNWRLPTLTELEGLYDEDVTQQSETMPLHLTELITLSACCPWAADTRGLGGLEGGLLDFTDGYIMWQYWTYGKTYPGRALPVRYTR
jgi:hypothetical protein